VDDEAALAARHLAAQRALWRSLGEGTPGGSVIERPGGVLAAIVPARADRSVFNSVIYEDPDALLAVRDELDAAYVAAGIEAWTVWVRPGDDRLRAPLEAAGHVFDAQPMLMAATIGELELEPRSELCLDPAPTWDTVARLNDLAYGIDPKRSFAGALGAWRDPLVRAYVARVEGEPVCGMGTRVEHGCCDVLFVATDPAARGRGLASELMRLALREAYDGGARTTVLEATALGEPVYARMGYRSLGRLGMYELRRECTAS
jgi:ribosomal protein S18 acetylase RimI-like enzyme